MPYGQIAVDRITGTNGNSISPESSVFRNRIINGAMTIDQRNAGASVTITNTSAVTYTLDRWNVYGSAASKFSVQQDAGAVTPPAGFNDYLGVTSLAATSVGSGDYYFVSQYIEGFNTADLNFGTANAKTVTLSFWVRSSLTGTFGGSLTNSAINRSYPFSFTINSANTWEYETITIAGDTSGTWVGATNGVGLRVFFSIGMGSSNSGTAGAWAGGDYRSTTGATSVVGTNGATFYITGVQLEVGSQATSFDYRPYGTELALCQRYYYLHVRGNSKHIGRGNYYSTTHTECSVYFPVTMRTTTTLAITTGTDYYVVNRSGGSDTLNSLTLNPETSESCASIYNNSEASGTSGVGGNFCTNNASASIAFSAEL